MFGRVKLINMEKINYSFIIPHKNCPELLKRCINSIPVRKDIQIIIIDDNSDIDKKPSIDRGGLEIVILDKSNSKGAGKARNVGLKQAKGKWLLFADADDYYTEGFLFVLDKYVNSKSEVIYFNAISVYSDTLKSANRTRELQTIIDEYVTGKQKDIDYVKYKTHTPWNKMIRATLVKDNHIFFEEVVQGNDAMFSFLVGYSANNITVLADSLYVYTYTEGSLTTQKKDNNMILCSIVNFYKQNKFFTYIGKNVWASNLIRYVYRQIKNRGLLYGIRLIYVLLNSYNDIKLEENKYISFAEKIEIKNHRSIHRK